jgi:hypothetical protein
VNGSHQQGSATADAASPALDHDPLGHRARDEPCDPLGRYRSARAVSGRSAH